MVGQQGIRAGKAFVELYANDRKLTRGLRAAQRKLKRFGATVTAVGKQMAVTGSIIAAPLALSLRIGANFADQMSKVKAVTSGTAKEFDILNEKAKKLGRTTSFTATQVAEGMVGLGRAGFSRKEIDQAITGLLDLARATDTEMAEATDIAAATLRQFNLEASETGRVVDVLTATANGSAQILTDLGESMKFVAPLASEAGESIEQTAAALGIMANNGIKGSMAGTSLARAYKNLSSSKTQKTMEAIGVSVADANGNMRPMVEILHEIAKATEGLGTKDRLNIFEKLFGRGLASNIKLAKSGLKFDDMFDKIQNSAGLAGKVAKEMDDNLGGSFRMFMSAAEGVAIAIKDALDKPVRSALKSITQFLAKMAEWIEENQGVVKAVAAVAAVLLVAGGALIAIGGTIAAASFAFGGLITAVTAISAVFAFLSTPIAGAIAVIVGVVAALAGVTAWLIKSGDAVKQFGKLILSVFNLFVNYLKSGIFGLAGELLWASLKVVWLEGITDLNKTWDKLKDAWSGVTNDFVSKWKSAIGDVKKEWSGFKDEVSGKEATKADEGPIVVSKLTPEELKRELSGIDDKPIMPLFAEDPEETEDPQATAAQKRFDALTKKLGEINIDNPTISAARSGEVSTQNGLKDVISFINRSGEDKMLKAQQDTNSLLAELITATEDNRIQSLEAG